MVPQLDKVPISEVGRQEGTFVEQDTAVSEFNGFHAAARFSTPSG
jgi:hypothetical protein